MKCKDCAGEISTEQHGKYFGRCSDCYGDYKRKTAKQSLIPGLLFVALSLLYFMLSFVLYSSHLDMRLLYIMSGLCNMFVGTVWMLKAWLWAFTEVLSWRYEKKKSISLLAALLPMMIVMIIAVIFLVM
jgi:hypothetical protein